MYCGMSLARVGLDFRGLLPPVFEACILAMFSKVGPIQRLALACAKFVSLAGLGNLVHPFCVHPMPCIFAMVSTEKERHQRAAWGHACAWVLWPL